MGKLYIWWVTNVIPNGQMKKRKRETIPIASNGSPQMDLKHYRLSQNGKSKLRLNTKEEGFRQLVNDKRDFMKPKKLDSWGKLILSKLKFKWLHQTRSAKMET